MHRVSRLDVDLGDFSRGRAGQFENRLVGFDFHHDLVGRNRVAHGHFQGTDFRLVDVLTDGGKLELDAHDVLLFVTHERG